MKGRIELLYYCTPTQEDIVYCTIINVRRKGVFLSHKFKVKYILPGQYYVHCTVKLCFLTLLCSIEQPGAKQDCGTEVRSGDITIECMEGR